MCGKITNFANKSYLMSEFNRKDIAEFILNSLKSVESDIQQSITKSKENIPHFIIDNLLPEDIAQKIHDSFPDSNQLILKNNIRERKLVSAQMNMHSPIIEETLFAFQEDEVVRFIDILFGGLQCQPDKTLYAGGISKMEKNHFLNPHLDNSHDKDRKLFRVLNLLYYVTPNWKKSNGGHLELWPNGPKDPGILVENKFNRLVVMLTNQNSWHSVSKVKGDRPRTCISNYYFSKTPPSDTNYFHVTSFRGRSNQKIKDFILRNDASLRSLVRRFFKKGIKKNKHYYKKD